MWIPSLPNHRLDTVDEDLKKSQQTVDDILSIDNRSWDLNPIRVHISDQAREAILMIPIPRYPSDDRLRWTVANNVCVPLLHGLLSVGLFTSLALIVLESLYCVVCLSSPPISTFLGIKKGAFDCLWGWKANKELSVCF
ncbi:hypothetical protein K1719_011189 [Acacia pycnantha]|nr:hypothetical protein K1719_011189 [Acacia pycnantha]